MPFVNWGQPDETVVNGTSGVGNVNEVRSIAGTFDDVDGARLVSASFWLNGNTGGGNCRPFIYQGGALDNPTGAVLKYDFGKVVIPQDVFQWHTFTCFDEVYLDPLDPVRIGLAMGFPGYTLTAWSTNSADAGDFDPTRGRGRLYWVNTTFNGNLPDLAVQTHAQPLNFGNFWYPWYLTYEIPSPVFRSYYLPTRG